MSIHTRPQVSSLGPLRHRCYGCGASCQGLSVRMLSEQEEARILRLGGELGVAEPVVDHRLRAVDGACVFLEADSRCAIHSRFGLDAKPAICVQYPTVVIETEGGHRVGVDPGCLRADKSWRHGRKQTDFMMLVHEAKRAPDFVRFERLILDLSAKPRAHVGGLLHALGTGAEHAGRELPPGFGTRWIQRLQGAPLGELLSEPALGRAVPEALAPVLAAIDTWDPASPPAWPALALPEEAWVIEALRRLVFLRLGAPGRSPIDAAALTLGGAVACGWALAGDAGFGAALSAWTRATRTPAVAAALIPDPRALLALLGVRR